MQNVSTTTSNQWSKKKSNSHVEDGDGLQRTLKEQGEETQDAKSKQRTCANYRTFEGTVPVEKGKKVGHTHTSNISVIISFCRSLFCR